MKKPTFQIERDLARKGHFVIGVDEAGCGCLAGPVIAAAVHLPLNSRMAGIHDSKLLAPEKRIAVVGKFVEMGLNWTIGAASAKEVDELNVRQASLLAMKRAVEAYKGATFALVDAWKIPNLKIRQQGIVHGDRLVKSVAAASIIAKVVRDRLMAEYDKEYRGYGFAKHKGYGTKMHKEALMKFGLSPIHRKTFTLEFI